MLFIIFIFTNGSVTGDRWFDLGAWGTFFQDSAKQAPLAEEARASFVLGTSCFLGFATSAKISWS